MKILTTEQLYNLKKDELIKIQTDIVDYLKHLRTLKRPTQEETETSDSSPTQVQSGNTAWADVPNPIETTKEVVVNQDTESHTQDNTNDTSSTNDTELDIKSLTETVSDKQYLDFCKPTSIKYRARIRKFLKSVESAIYSFDFRQLTMQSPIDAHKLLDVLYDSNLHQAEVILTESSKEELTPEKIKEALTPPLEGTPSDYYIYYRVPMDAYTLDDGQIDYLYLSEYLSSVLVVLKSVGIIVPLERVIVDLTTPKSELYSYAHLQEVKDLPLTEEPKRAYKGYEEFLGVKGYKLILVDPLTGENPHIDELRKTLRAEGTAHALIGYNEHGVFTTLKKWQPK